MGSKNHSISSHKRGTRIISRHGFQILSNILFHNESCSCYNKMKACEILYYHSITLFIINSVENNNQEIIKTLKAILKFSYTVSSTRIIYYDTGRAVSLGIHNCAIAGTGAL